MRANGMRLVAALGVMLGVASPSAADGQRVPRPAVEAHYTRIGYAGAATGAPVGGGTVRAEGLGGRVMWPLAAAHDPASWLGRHAAVGLFGAYTPNPERGFSAGQVGIAADLAPLATPLAGRVEPFVSLGAGALHTTTRGLFPRPTPRPELPVEPAAAGRSPLVAGSRSATRFLLVPAVGARLAVRPTMAVQGDLRTLVTTGDGTGRVHHAVGTGVRLAF